VANAIAAATYKFDRAGRTTTQLIGDLSEFDPVVRNFAAIELSIRTLTSTELTTLRTMLGGSNANGRMGACQALGLLKDATAMTLITQRLDKTIETDPWVRATAANALRDYGTNANSQVNTMLARFADNAADPDTIVWSDPLQASNGKLAWALFDSGPEQAISTSEPPRFPPRRTCSIQPSVPGSSIPILPRAKPRRISPFPECPSPMSRPCPMISST
jgi:hypothetical protein